jgi:hypothetical protein
MTINPVWGIRRDLFMALQTATIEVSLAHAHQGHTEGGSSQTRQKPEIAMDGVP